MADDIIKKTVKRTACKALFLLALAAIDEECIEFQSLMYILSQVVTNQARTVLELGASDHGNSTITLLLACSLTSGHLYSMDINSREQLKEHVKTIKLDKIWTFIQGNDLDGDWTQDLDILMVDSDHHYKHVLSELRKYVPYVIVGGSVILHDTNLPLEEVGDNPVSPRKAMLEYFKNESPSQWEVTDIKSIENGLTILKRLS